uniref:Glutamate receptor 1 n=1 Tax=Polyphagotarsonemus latus TaxID=1204166 RepID=A0AAN0LHA1_9ACAR
MSKKFFQFSICILISLLDFLNCETIKITNQHNQSKISQFIHINSKNQSLINQFETPEFLYQRDEPNRIVQKISIGAIFTPKDKALRSAFIYAVKAHNRFESSRFQIEPIIDVIDTNDAFRFTRQLCLQLSRGIFALVTPVIGVSYETLVSYSNTFHLPFLYAGSSLTKQNEKRNLNKQNPSFNKKENFMNTDLNADFGIYLQPDIVHAIYKTILYLNWDHFIYLYDNEDGLIKLQNLLEYIHGSISSSSFNRKIDLKIVHRVHNEYDAHKFLRNYQNFRVKQYSASINNPLPESSINYINNNSFYENIEEINEEFEEIFNSKLDKSSPIYVILNCEAKLVASIIQKHMDDIYMSRKNFHYLIINLNIDDLAIYNLTEYGALNITGFRILNKSSLNYRQFISYWKSLDPVLWPGAGSKNILTDAALIHDSARFLFESIEQLLSDQKLENFNQNSNLSITNSGINCAQIKPLEPWVYGKKVYNQLLKTKMEGLTGNLEFSSISKRTNYSLEIIQTTMNSELTKIAEYHYYRPKHDRFNKNSNKFNEENILLDDQYGKLNIVPANFQRIINKDSALENKTYIVTSILEEPFLMIKKQEHGQPELKGNDRFEGYCKDLADLIADQLNINYELRLVADGKYGGRNESLAGGFNGMVGELIRKEADMAIAPLTITSAREKVIHFTKPFLSLGISIMIKKPERKSEGSFSFMNPLSEDIWIFILLSYGLVSIVIFLVSKYSPSEIRKVLSVSSDVRNNINNNRKLSNISKSSIENEKIQNLEKNISFESEVYNTLSNKSFTNNSNQQFNCSLNSFDNLNEDDRLSNDFRPSKIAKEISFDKEIDTYPVDLPIETQENFENKEILYLNEFNLVNSMWFALSALFQQGVDVCPRSYAGRIAGSVWWFFTLIIISSYTANLAAFLTVERMVTPINSADDLAKQTEVEYGVLKDSSTQEFFRNSQVQVFRRMWEFMSARPHVFVDTYTEGIARVRESKGKYAFLMESTQNDYINTRLPCDTMKVDRNLDAKGFGIATPLYSSLHVKLNLGVLLLTEKGDLTRLENKWWFDQCKSNSDTNDFTEIQTSLTLDNVEGCFYILLAGLVCSFLVAIIDLFIRCFKESIRDNVPFIQALCRNIKISFAGKLIIIHEKNQICCSTY